MLLQIPNVLRSEQVSRFRSRIDAVKWVDGNVTSAISRRRRIDNEQLPEESPKSTRSAKRSSAALARSPLFFSAALPKHSFPPLFNRYAPT